MADKLCPVVVGRDAQLRTLTQCLSAAAEGGGRCVFVTGEPGIGKSRLVREVREVRALAEAAVRSRSWDAASPGPACRTGR